MSTPGAFVVVVADRVSPSGLQALTDDSRFDVRFVAGSDNGTLDEALDCADALIVRSSNKVTAELLERAPKLRVIGRAGVGVDNIDLEAATARGVPVLNAPEGNTVSAAELTFALILSVARHVSAADRSVRAGEWQRSQFAGAELRSKVLGLVGAGRIGGEVAKRAIGFGMSVVIHDPYLTHESAARLGAEKLPLEALLDKADVISLHVPLTESTRGMIGAEQLARLKPAAFVVNVARGGVLDESALAAALEDGTVAGAALDVFEDEPLPPDSPLRSAPNIVLTPHLGASTAEAQELVASEIASAVRSALLEGDLTRAVNAPAIGGEALARLRPLMDLARRIGHLARATTTGGLHKVEIRYAGEEGDGLSSLMASVLVGLLSHAVGKDRVNFVNAVHLARARGIRLSTTRSEPRADYSEFLEVRVDADSGRTQVSGALLEGHHPRLVGIAGYRVDILPSGTMLLLRNRDVPGVIGRVGTLLGAQGLNIGEYHQARLEAGGDAFAVVSVDGVVDGTLMVALLELDEIDDARVVELG